MKLSEEDALRLATINEFLRRVESTMTMGDWAFTYSFNQDTADRVKKEMGLLDGGES